MPDPWQVYDRYAKARAPEPIYGEKWLRWAYERRLGRFTTWALAARAFFSRLYGWRMRRPESARLVAPFVAQFGIEMDEAVKPVEAFTSFNDFFTRELRETARPLPGSPEAVVFPADGRHFLLRELAGQPLLWAKHESFSVESLLGPLALGAGTELLGGDAVVSRLAPIDYHRYHFPWSGRIVGQIVLAGPLYSVHPLALRRSMRYLVANKRMVTILEDERIGRWAMVEIGATNVGSIVETHPAGEPAERGAEKGYFEFGGSCVVTVWPRGHLDFAADLQACAGEGIELYAHVRDEMARLRRAP